MSHDDRLFAAASMLGLMGCLRGGEFTKKPGSRRETLLHNMVNRAPRGAPRQGVQIDIAHPKGKWYLASQPVFAFEVPEAGVFGVGTLLDAYRRRSVVSLVPTGPAFLTSAGKVLSRDFMVLKTESLLKQAGIVQLDPDGQPTRVMSASWRAGHVRGLKDADVSDPVVMASGRWVSNAWTSYFALQASDLQRASASVWKCSSPVPPAAHRVGISSRSALEIACADEPLNPSELMASLNRRAPISVDREGSSDSESDVQPSYGRSVNRSAGNPSL